MGKVFNRGQPDTSLSINAVTGEESVRRMCVCEGSEVEEGSVGDGA